MIHKDCGGEIKEEWSWTYEYEDETIPAYVCKKCCKEIISDIEVEIEGWDDE
jgi:hypothetical protein